jgi:RNA polymerase sigma-70 factor (ECF subfamily)
MPSTSLPIPAAGGPREFATTCWSVVLAAGGDSTRAQPALAKLCTAYWYPIYAFVRRQGEGTHDAQDLTQEFFARLIERGSLSGVVRERGRFRSWLLAAVKHFLVNEWHRSHRQKRGGGATIVSLDDEAERRYLAEPVDPRSAEQLYDRSWAVTLLDKALGQLQEEWRAAGKLAQFDVLKGCFAGDRTSYAIIGETLGMTEGAVRVTVHRLREQYRMLLRAEIAETVASPEDTDDELRHLFASLGG